MNERINQEIEPPVPIAVQQELSQVGEIIENHRMAIMPLPDKSPVANALGPLLQPENRRVVIELRDLGDKADTDENAQSQDQKQNASDQKSISVFKKKSDSSLHTIRNSNLTGKDNMRS